MCMNISNLVSIIFMLVIFIIAWYCGYKLENYNKSYTLHTNYEKAMINKEKIIKKTIKEDVNFIKEKIKEMVNEGKTYNYFIYDPRYSSIAQYIKDNKLFSDCEINVIQVNVCPFNLKEVFETAIEIKFLEAN